MNPGVSKPMTDVPKCDKCNDVGFFWDQDPHIRECLVSKFCDCPKGQADEDEAGYASMDASELL